MSSQSTHYCLNCGRRGNPGLPNCEACGAPRELTRRGLISGTAFVLHELQAWPMADALTPQLRARLKTYYEDQLNGLTAPARPATAAPPPMVSRERPFAAPSRQRTVERIPPQAPPPPPRVPAPPRPEFDWRWLAEQQANLFLFAGAFLTVVAALIYVGYSGQAVSGALKMTLLAIYTLAFLGAGALCLRIERVETAGRVFFGIGAILVPLNFVAARTIFGEGDLSAQSMWLAGSVVTAGFYTAVAYLGLGRLYSFGGGVALVSAALAACVVSDLPVEWAPSVFIALATAMSLANLVGPATLRSRVGEIWAPQAHAVALASAAVALGVALLSIDGEEIGTEVATRWFLPLSFLAFTAYAALHMVTGREQGAGVAAVAGFGAAFIAMAFAADAPPEFYVLVLAALSIAFGGAMLAASPVTGGEGTRPRLPNQFDEMLRWAAMISTGLALVVALFVLKASAGDEPAYDLGSRWFLAATFALVAPFYAIDAFVRRQRTGLVGMLAALTGVAGGTVYALEVSPEYYAFAFLLPAVAFGATARWARHPVLDRLHALWREDTFVLGYAAAAAGVAIAAIAAFIGADEYSGYEPQFRAYLVLALSAAAGFAAIDASRGSRIGGIALAGALVGVGGGVAYAIDPSAEFYAFGALVPAIAIGTAARFAPTRRTSWLPELWRPDTFIVGWAAVAVGLAVAIGALAVSEDRTTNPYEPATRWFLPLAFAAAAAFAALDASRRRRPETSAALLVAIGAAIVSLPYALELEPAAYGVALAGAAVLVAAGGRAWTPAWIDTQVRDGIAVAGITAAWLLFEGAYAEAPRVGAAVHFTAALFYAAAALTDRSERTLSSFLDMPQAARVRIAGGWLYAAGLTAVIGYIDVLRSLPAAEDAEGGSMAMSLMFASLAFAAAGVATKFFRPEFRMHFYVMSLLVGLFSLSTGATAGTLTVVLCVYVASFGAIAVFEDEPLLGAPSALFGLAAIAAWREHADAAWWIIPASYSAIGVLAAGASTILPRRKPWWIAAMIASGGYTVAAPLAGFGILQYLVDETGHIGATPFYETALYQWSTVSVAVAGLVALGAAAIDGRRWAIVPATAVLTVALLLQIGRFNPENAQAYTAVIGVYLVALGLLGLWKFRLIPEIEDAAPIVEALGAAIIMFPSFAQSIEAGWRYQWILLAEAIVFFALSVALRRRAMLAASLVAMVLVAGRALFDAVNALPNWVVVMIAGVALLGIGMGILLGRERWSRWQEALLGWWDEAGQEKLDVGGGR